MRRKDLISSIFWMAIGIYLCYGGYDLGLGFLSEPGPGFIFFWVGIIILTLSFAIIIKALTTRETADGLRILWSGVHWERPIYILVGLSLFAYLFSILGFILSSILLLIFLFKVVEPQGWLTAVLGAVLSSFSAYLLFQVLLGCRFPAGFLN